MDQIAIAVATGVIAAFTVILCVLQWIQNEHNKAVTRANYKLALFDKRMTVYLHIEAFLQEFMREGRPSMKGALKLRWKARTAHFLFPKESLAFVDELFQKSMNYHRAYSDWEPLRARAAAHEQLTPEEQARKQASLEQMHALEGWFVEQIKEGRLEKQLGPYLALPETV